MFIGLSKGAVTNERPLDTKGGGGFSEYDRTTTRMYQGKVHSFRWWLAIS